MIYIIHPYVFFCILVRITCFLLAADLVGGVYG